MSRSCLPARSVFLSTPSARRATVAGTAGHIGVGISIHALREEGDLPVLPLIPSGVNFYPRPSRGGRQLRPEQYPVVAEISIHALREEGDVVSAGASLEGERISIHALREEGDRFFHF